MSSIATSSSGTETSGAALANFQDVRKRVSGRPDGLAGLYPQDNLHDADSLALCRDMGKMCREIDEHFLKASEKSITFEKHPDVDQPKIVAFRNKIVGYKSVVDSDQDLAANFKLITHALADTSAMDDLWICVMQHLSHAPEKYWNNGPWWNTWIGDLVMKTEDLPDLLLRIRMSNKPIYNDSEWYHLRRKVAFLDAQMDYAYTNEFGGFPPRERRVHLGKSANKKKQEKLSANKRLTIAGKDFTEDTNYAWSPREGSSDRTEIAVSEALLPEKDPWLFYLVLAGTAVGMILLAPAWRFSKYKVGGLQDAAFYFLIQSCLMQAIGVAIIVRPVWARLPLWAWGVTVLSAACSIGAPISYVFIPMDWSSTIAFFGSGLANLVFMRSAFTVTEQKAKVS